MTPPGSIKNYILIILNMIFYLNLLFYTHLFIAANTLEETNNL